MEMEVTRGHVTVANTIQNHTVGMEKIRDVIPTQLSAMDWHIKIEILKYM